MTAEHRPRFDTDLLRDLAGAQAYARGEAYHRDGQVEILTISAERVLARVAGTEDYRTVVTGRGAAIDGECSCRAFEEWGVCKHIVAVALAANAAGDGGDAEAAGALPRIREYLKARGIDALVEMVLAQAERDGDLFRRLELAAAAAVGDDDTIDARLRQAIDNATRMRGFVDFREASAWAAGVEAPLDLVADLVSRQRAELALKLVRHAILRIEEAYESVDDSDGCWSGLLERARDIHLAACRAAKPDPVLLARDLFAREIGSDHDAFYGAVGIYEDVLGEAGLAEHRRLAAEAWARLPPRAGPQREARTGSEIDAGSYLVLKHMLDFHAERDSDVDARIALRAKDLSSPRHYLQLAKFCRDQGRHEEALRHAEEGLWLFEDARPDESLVLFTAGLLEKAGRTEEAGTYLWRAFEKAPALDLFDRLRKLGGEPARERAVAILEKRLGEGKATPYNGAAANLLIRIFMQEGMPDAAWAAMRRHGGSRWLADELAAASEATHPGEALAVYTERVEGLVRSGGNPAYEEAAALIARMAALRGEAEQSVYVAELKERFGRKRNFMKLLR